MGNDNHKECPGTEGYRQAGSEDELQAEGRLDRREILRQFARSGPQKGGPDVHPAQDKPEALQLPKDPLLQPFRLKGLTLRNRVISTSHASMLDDGGMPLERYQRYHEEKALGGLALTMVGGRVLVAMIAGLGLLTLRNRRRLNPPSRHNARGLDNGDDTPA
jgi:hypothetical protein